MDIRQQLQNARRELDRIEASLGNQQMHEALRRPGSEFVTDSNGNLVLREAAPDPETVKAHAEEYIRVFESIGMSRTAAEHAAAGRPETWR